MALCLSLVSLLAATLCEGITGVGTAGAPIPCPGPPFENMSTPLRPPPDAPVFTDAGKDLLHLEICINMKNQSCPTDIEWILEKAEPLESKVRTLQNICFSEILLNNLKPNKLYTIVSKPVVRTTGRNNMMLTSNWYGQETRNDGFFPATTARTCQGEVPPLRDVRVHTMSEGWVGLSWLPPADRCFTQYTYFARHGTKEGEEYFVRKHFVQMGSLWSGNLWHSVGPKNRDRVVPCTAWPDRHCLVVRGFYIRLEQQYVVEVYISRINDGRVSAVAKREFTITFLVPGPPEKVACDQANSTSFELSWSSPLRLGGILEYATVRVSKDYSDMQHWRQKLDGSDLRPMYNQTITGLQPSTCYEVSVWFVSTVGMKGENATILVWTTPAENQTTMGTTNSSIETTWAPDNATCVFISEHKRRRNNHEEVPLKWIVSCAVLIAFTILFLIFY